jgi:nucleotide-binding universal stress UspA family protein
MSVQKKLLVPIDGSENALRALAYVLKRRATDKQLRIYLLNVQPPIPANLFVTRGMIAQEQESMGKEALAKAKRLLARHRAVAQIAVRIGEPAATIVKAAAQQHCREIVMGTRGLGSLKGLLLGSITTKVIHLARVPVTVVP